MVLWISFSHPFYIPYPFLSAYFGVRVVVGLVRRWRTSIRIAWIRVSLTSVTQLRKGLFGLLLSGDGRVKEPLHLFCYGLSLLIMLMSVPYFGNFCCRCLMCIWIDYVSDYLYKVRNYRVFQVLSLWLLECEVHCRIGIERWIVGCWSLLQNTGWQSVF